MSSEFINRAKEQQIYRSILSGNYDTNKVIVLYADRGVGKSNFTKIVLANQTNRIPLKIKMDDLAYNDLSYIKKIIEVINQLAENNHYDFVTLESYIKMDESKDHSYNYKLFSQLINTYKLLIPLKTISERNLAKGDYSTEKILYGDEESLQILVNYIKYNLEKNQIILNIENVQAIDISSLNILLKIIQYTKNSIYILEYTCNARNINIDKEVLEDKCNQIQNCNAILEQLKIIDIKEILLPYIKPTMLKKFETLIDNLKITYDGNIKKIKDYVAILDKNDLVLDTNINDSTNKRISLLPMNEINLLCIISAYPSQLHIDTLKDYFSLYINDPFNDLDLLIENLNNEFITNNNHNIFLSDDTISQVILTQNQFERYVLIAQNNFIHYYQKLLNTNNFTFISKIEVLTNLFYLYIKVDKKNIFNILEQIKLIIIENYFTTKAIQLMDTLSKDMFSMQYSENESKIIQFTLIDLYYFLGLHNKGIELINQIKIDSNKKTIYKIAFFNRIEKNSEIIEIINEELNKKDLNLSYELSLSLFLFVAYFSIYDIENANKIRKILLKNKYHNCYEYGFVLRNLQLGESYSKSLINIEKSIEHFKKINSQVYEGHTRITKMMQLIRLGELEKAEIELVLIKKLLKNRSREKHYILINQAVLNLYKTIQNNEKIYYSCIEYDLNLSLKITEKPFYKAAIYNNLMVLYIMKKEYEKVESCIINLEKILVQQSNESLKNRIYYNFYKYYQDRDNLLSQLYLKRIKISSSELNAFWKTKLDNEPCNNKDYEFLIKFDYILILTSYWHFDISQIQ